MINDKKINPGKPWNHGQNWTAGWHSQKTVENLEVEKKANQMVGYFKTQIISTTTQLNKQIIYEHIAIFQ